MRSLRCRHSPASVARCLTKLDGLGEYFLWSGPDEVVVACGSRASIVLEARVLSVRDSAGAVVESVETKDPFADAPRLLASKWFGGRAFGYVGFELAGFRYSYAKSRGRGLHLVEPRLSCTIDAEEVRLDGGDDDVARAARALEDWSDPADRSTSSLAPEVVESDQARYAEAIAEIQEAIHRGAIGKVVVARSTTLPGRLAPLATMGRMGQSVADRHFAFTLGNVRGVGACPAMLLTASADGEVMTNPLAGTRPRGKTAEEDQRLRESLFLDPKELSEHAMSIKVAYDEIRAAVAPNPARVEDFMSLKIFPFVQHISSRACGRLPAGKTSWDVLREVFPGITVTGIDKGTAIGFLDRLEPFARGVYGGAVGWVRPGGELDLGLAIRTAFDYGDGVTLNAGAGIVHGSDPTAEFEESANKMRTMASRVVLEDG